MAYEVTLSLSKQQITILKEVLNISLEAADLQKTQLEHAVANSVLTPQDLENINDYLYNKVIPQEVVISSVLNLLENPKKEEKPLIIT